MRNNNKARENGEIFVVLWLNKVRKHGKKWEMLEALEKIMVIIEKKTKNLKFTVNKIMSDIKI